MAGRAGRPLTRHSAFWDASALVPLCVTQSLTPKSIVLYQSYEAVVWWATPIEIASALARLVRMQQLDTGGWVKSRKLAEALADSWSVIRPSQTIQENAIQLVNRFGLKAGDALQLAAALNWCEDSPKGAVFLTADQKLRDAAVISGFDAKAL
jgi:predicted nucleic acid-binding protein